MKKLANLFMISLLLINCQSNSLLNPQKAQVNEPSAEKLTEYKVEISAIKVRERKVKININTNFPDGTNFSLWICRHFYQNGSNITYSAQLFDKNYSVKNGGIETIIDIKSDAEWYNERQRLIKAIPKDFPPISRISNNVTINILYTSTQAQPPKVVKILGARGEFITGAGAERSGTGTAGRSTSFTASKEFYLPLMIN